MGFDTSIENSFGKYEYDKGRVHGSSRRVIIYDSYYMSVVMKYVTL